MVRTLTQRCDDGASKLAVDAGSNSSGSAGLMRVTHCLREARLSKEMLAEAAARSV